MPAFSIEDRFELKICKIGNWFVVAYTTNIDGTRCYHADACKTGLAAMRQYWKIRRLITRRVAR